MRRFFINNPAEISDIIIISKPEFSHIVNVLRYNKGDYVNLFDPQGFEYEAKIIFISKKQKKIEAVIESKKLAQSESDINITVAQALLKESAMDDIIRPLTELGINKWIPFIAKRSVPKIKDENIKKKQKRWEKLAIEAVKQTERGIIPEISAILSFKEVLEIGKKGDLKIIFYEEEKKPLNNVNLKIKDAFIIIGPEGGFSINEIKEAKNAGFETAGMGPRILKAPTAAISAVAIIQFLYGDMG
jgi:16S rRNA (uracil1498-N3)-methyltransferase